MSDKIGVRSEQVKISKWKWDSENISLIHQEAVVIAAGIQVFVRAMAKQKRQFCMKF